MEFIACQLCCSKASLYKVDGTCTGAMSPGEGKRSIAKMSSNLSATSGEKACAPIQIITSDSFIHSFRK
jgi:hypothetical protein